MKKNIIILLFTIFALTSCFKQDTTDFSSMTSDELVGYSETNTLTQDNVNQILDNFNTCSVDSDCEAFYGECPLGCHLAVNKSNIDAAKTIITNWKSTLSEQCVYDCVGIEGVSCVNNKCNVIPQTSQNFNPDNILFDDTYDVRGVGPDISLEAIGEDVLSLHKTYEDHSDHIFIEKNLWEAFANGNDITLPGNKVHFTGTAIGIEAGAGNRYYNVISIERLEKVGDATREEIDTLIQSYGACEQDSDCIGYYGECPFSCHIAVNSKYETITKDIMTNYINNHGEKCVYKCMEMGEIKCNNYQCSAEQK